MSTKKFTVIDTRTGLKKTFDSEANTVGELKADLVKLDISTTDMAIQEGLTRTELGGDDTYLPHDVPYKGGITSNLVFRITQAEKKIKSGSGSPRSYAYDQVRKLGLQEVIAAKYGKNFTLCKTVELIAEVEAATKTKSKSKAKAEITPKDEPKMSEGSPKCPSATENAILVLADKLVYYDVFSADDSREIADIIGHSLNADEYYSVKDINDMFDDM